MVACCLAHLGTRYLIFLRVLFKWRWIMVIILALYLVNTFFSPFDEDKLIAVPLSSRDLEMQQKKEKQPILTVRNTVPSLNRSPGPPNLLSERIISSDSLSLRGWWMSHVKWDVSEVKRRSSSKTRQVFSVVCSPYRIVETYQHLRLNTSLSIRGILFQVSSTAWKMQRRRSGIMKKFPPFYGARVHVALTSGKSTILKLEFEKESGKVKSQKAKFVLKKGERIRSVTVMLGCFGYEGSVAFTDLFVEPILDKKFTYNSLTADDFLDSCPPPVHTDHSASHPNINTTLEVLYSSFSPKDERSITLVTQLTITRIAMLNMNLRFWQGPISVVIYVTLGEGEKITTKRKQVKSRVLLHMFRKFSTASVVIMYGSETGERYPINRLRNTAIKHSKTRYLFLVDADFVPSPRLHDIARDHILEHTQRNKQRSQTAFVVPAFEELKGRRANLGSRELPETKSDLLEIIKEGITLSPFRQGDSPLSHSSTDYSRWYESNAPYKIHKYQDKYEPYLILRRTPEMPLYDERFKGYGMNKISHVIELSLLRYTFVVLPDVWIIHRHHRISPLSWVHRTNPGRRFANRLQRFEFISDVHSKHKLSGCR